MEKLEKITIHWSVGRYIPNAGDLEHYHFLIDDVGNVHKGNKPPESNLPSSVKAGTYVAHCGGGNSSNIGISLASMLGYVDRNHIGKYPFTKIQLEKACEQAALMCIKYNIEVSPSTVFTHYEFGKLHTDSSSFGKIDITLLPYDLSVKADEIGNIIRNKVQWYINKNKK